MPRLIDLWDDREAIIIDLAEWKRNRDKKAEPPQQPSLEEIDALLRRVYLHLHPHATKGEFRRWLAAAEDEDEDSTG